MIDYLPPAPDGAEQAESAYASAPASGFSLTGLVFVEAISVETEGAQNSFDETGFRLAALGASTTLGPLKLLAEFDFARDGEWRDVGVKTHVGDLHFALGQFKEPGSLTKYTPEGGSVVLEASRYASVFAIGRRLGLFARYDGSRLSIDAAVTDGALDGDAARGFARGQRGVMVRARTAVIRDDLTVHFGGYVRHLDYDGEGTVLKAGPHSALAPKTLKVSFTEYYGREARSSLLAGAEFGIAAGRWYADADAGRMEIDTPAGDFTVTAQSMEASVALTGETRRYDRSKGVFKPITPASPVNAGGLGALELTARADRIDFGQTLGGETTSYAVGLTWTPQANVRVLANYTRENSSRFAPESQSYAVRLQFSF